MKPRQREVEAFESLFQRVYEAVTGQALDKFGPSTLTDLVPASVVRQALDDIAGDDLLRMFARGYDDAARGVTDSPAFFDVRNVEASRFLESYKVKLATSISDTVNRRLTNALREGMDAGETIGQLRARVGEVVPELVRNGSERLARTESARAYGEGKVASWDQTGVKQKAWLLSPNPCDLCVAIWQKGPIAVGEPFFALGETLAGVTNDYQDVSAEPGHPNCICVTVPVFEEEP